MSRLSLSFIAGFGLCLAWSSPVHGQRELVARSVTEARRVGDEAALVHLAEEIGPAGVAECLEHAGRSGRHLCAQAARYLERPWRVLPVLGAVLQDHDRHLASRAAESLTLILSRLQAADLGPQEPLPSEVEGLLLGLRGVAENLDLSPDIRAQVVTISGELARVVGAGLEVPRQALSDPHVAVRRAAVSALIGSNEGPDLEALARVAAEEPDLLSAALAASGVCEATLGRGRPLPEAVASRVGQMVGDRSARLSILRPLMVCLARSTPATPLREQMASHPNEAIRAAWAELNGGGE